MTLRKEDLPHGVRHNNPGNISCPDGNHWVGGEGFDDRGFCMFNCAEAGIRAMVINLHAYNVAHGLKYLVNYIERWAPPEENDTEAYVKAVQDFMGVGMYHVVQWPDDIPALVHAIVKHEQGKTFYPEHVFVYGIKAGLDSTIALPSEGFTWEDLITEENGNGKEV